MTPPRTFVFSSRYRSTRPAAKPTAKVRKPTTTLAPKPKVPASLFSSVLEDARGPITAPAAAAPATTLSSTTNHVAPNKAARAVSSMAASKAAFHTTYSQRPALTPQPKTSRFTPPPGGHRQAVSSAPVHTNSSTTNSKPSDGRRAGLPSDEAARRSPARPLVQSSANGETYRHPTGKGPPSGGPIGGRQNKAPANKEPQKENSYYSTEAIVARNCKEDRKTAPEKTPAPRRAQADTYRLPTLDNNRLHDRYAYSSRGTKRLLKEADRRMFEYEREDLEYLVDIMMVNDKEYFSRQDEMRSLGVNELLEKAQELQLNISRERNWDPRSLSHEIASQLASRAARRFNERLEAEEKTSRHQASSQTRKRSETSSADTKSKDSHSSASTDDNDPEADPVGHAIACMLSGSKEQQIYQRTLSVMQSERDWPQKKRYSPHDGFEDEESNTKRRASPKVKPAARSKKNSGSRRSVSLATTDEKDAKAKVDSLEPESSLGTETVMETQQPQKSKKTNTEVAPHSGSGVADAPSSEDGLASPTQESQKPVTEVAPQQESEATQLSTSEKDDEASPKKTSNKRKSSGSEDDEGSSDESSSKKRKTTKPPETLIFTNKEDVKGLLYITVPGGYAVPQAAVRRRSSSPKLGKASVKRFLAGGA